MSVWSQDEQLRTNHLDMKILKVKTLFGKNLIYKYRVDLNSFLTQVDKFLPSEAVKKESLQTLNFHDHRSNWYTHHLVISHSGNRIYSAVFPPVYLKQGGPPGLSLS